MVPVTDRGAEWCAQDDHDRGARAQAADRAMAHGHNWGGTGRGRAAAGRLSDGFAHSLKYPFWHPPRCSHDGLSTTIRGGGNPNPAMAAMPLGEWTRRLGALPPKRMTASWSGSPDPTEYKLVAHSIAHQWQAPLGSSVVPRIISCASARLSTACHRARARQGQAFGGAEEAPSLTAAARDG